MNAEKMRLPFAENLNTTLKKKVLTNIRILLIKAN